MSVDNKEQQSWYDKLQHTYRLVIMRDESFEEVGSYRLTRLNIYLLLSSLVVTIAFFIILFIIFTPLKEIIPGYGDVNLRDDAEKLAKQVQLLQEQHKADSTYIASVQRIFSADYEIAENENEEGGEIEISPDDLNLERIEEDEELRNEVESNEPLIEVPENDEEVNYTVQRSIPLEQMFFVSPVKGDISYGFRQDKRHYGIDILAPKNTAIKAAMEGIVIQADWTLETGNTIAIQHKNNLITFYKHNSALLKKVGDTVQDGEAVAIIGNTGTLSSGPHLHFELWYNGKPIDPQEYISFN